MLLVLYLVSEGVLSPLIMPAMLPDMLDSAAATTTDTDNQKNKKVDKPGGKSAVCWVNYCVVQLFEYKPCCSTGACTINRPLITMHD